jgi:hypothetical protein
MKVEFNDFPAKVSKINSRTSISLPKNPMELLNRNNNE